MLELTDLEWDSNYTQLKLSLPLFNCRLWIGLHSHVERLGGIVEIRISLQMSQL